MIGRGSLQRCIHAAATAFANYRYPMLSIIHNQRGEYYSCITEQDLTKLDPPGEGGHNRLVFRGTLYELKTFTTAFHQGDLFGKQSDAPPETQ